MKDLRFQSLKKLSNAKLKRIMKLSPYKLERMAAYTIWNERKSK